MMEDDENLKILTNPISQSDKNGRTRPKAPPPPPKPAKNSNLQREKISVEVAIQEVIENDQLSDKEDIPTRPPPDPPVKNSQNKALPTNLNPFDDEIDDNEYRSGSSNNRDNTIMNSHITASQHSTSNTYAKISATSPVAAISSKSISKSTKEERTESRPSDNIQNETGRNGAASASAFSTNVKENSLRSTFTYTDHEMHSSNEVSTYDKQRGDPENEIYHKNRFSDFWMIVFLLLHTGQFLLLLVVGYDPLNLPAFVILTLFVITVIVLVIYARTLIVKSKLSNSRNVKLRGNVCTPDDEKDLVPDKSVYLLGFASILEGATFAIFIALVAGNDTNMSSSGFYTQDTLLQVLRFVSITLFAMHRMLRPANRIDPVRTMMEMEVISICWDAIDGSTMFELLDNSSYDINLENSIRVLMFFWYISMGVRMAIMFYTHLSPTAKFSRYMLTAPFQLAPQPTVDRTLQGLRLRAIVIMAMAAADFYAAAVRIAIAIDGKLDALQQDMLIKNIVFLASFSGAYDMFRNTMTRAWNNRILLTWPCFLQYPSRYIQLLWVRYLFVISYILIGCLMSVILIRVSNDNNKWTANIVMDILLCIIFLVYAQHIHVKADYNIPTWFFVPRKEFFTFPYKLGVGLGALMVISLVGARLPALYYNYNNMAGESEDVLQTYNNSMLLIVFSGLPMIFYSLYWSYGYMLFRKEFTASPGNYNAIHDPVISMVAISTMTEGTMDVLSAATLMQLAEETELSTTMDGAIVMFCLLEIFNACQSFALQCILSGGHDDTPADLVRWSAYLRVARVLIDFGAIVLRVVLWVNYGAISSVFLVKNLYNLLHTIAQIERWQGVSLYPKGTMFSEFVSPADWYGMTKEEWRKATKDTLLDQARSGRGV